MKQQPSQVEINDYIQKNVIPGFMPLLDMNIKSALWGENGDLIIATNKLANAVGFADYKQIQGLSVKKLLILGGFKVFVEKFPVLEKVFSATNLTLEKELLSLEIIKKMTWVKDQVFATAMPTNAILIHPFLKIHETALLLQYMPIFHPCGKVIAVQSYLRNFNMFGVHDYFSGYEQKLLNIPSIMKDVSELPINLTTRQYEVTFLLTIGMTQRRIAEFLGISHGTVSKLIADTICPKFGIDDSNSQHLIDKVREMKLHHYLPSSLCKPWLIVLNDDNIVASDQ